MWYAMWYTSAMWYTMSYTYTSAMWYTMSYTYTSAMWYTMSYTYTSAMWYTTMQCGIHLERCNVVYKLKCSCGNSYLGQT